MRRRIYSGPIGGLVSHPIRTTPLRPSLTPGEHAVVVLVAAGWSNVEIAQQRGVCLQVVKNALWLACARLGARNRTALAVIAVQQGLIPPVCDFAPRDDRGEVWT